MTLKFDPATWYYEVAGDPSVVVSARRGALVPAGDAEHQAWLSAGNSVTRTVSNGERFEYLLKHAPAAVARLAPEFLARGFLTPRQANDHLRTAGCRVTSESNPEVDGTYPVDPATMEKLGSLRRVVGNSYEFVNVADADGRLHKLKPETLVALHNALMRYVDSLNATELLLLGGHEAEWPAQPAGIP